MQNLKSSHSYMEAQWTRTVVSSKRLFSSPLIKVTIRLRAADGISTRQPEFRRPCLHIAAEGVATVDWTDNSPSTFSSPLFEAASVTRPGDYLLSCSSPLKELTPVVRASEVRLHIIADGSGARQQNFKGSRVLLPLMGAAFADKSFRGSRFLHGAADGSGAGRPCQRED